MGYTFMNGPIGAKPERDRVEEVMGLMKEIADDKTVKALDRVDRLAKIRDRAQVLVNGCGKEWVKGE